MRPAWRGIARLLGLLTAALAGAGCSPLWTLGPGAVLPSIAVSDVTFPNVTADDTVINIPYNTDTIEVVGWVDTERASSSLGGRIPGVMSGDILGIRQSDYGQAMLLLQDRYCLDGLLNKTVDTKRWVIDVYFIRFYRMHTVVGGIGYRFRDHEKLHGHPRGPAADPVPAEIP